MKGHGKPLARVGVGDRLYFLRRNGRVGVGPAEIGITRRRIAMFIAIRRQVSQRQSRRRPGGAGLRLETLEDRYLPSTVTVTNLSDHDPGSLRDALAQTVDGDTIEFAPDVRGVIMLTGTELSVTHGVSVFGPGAAQLAVSGGAASRVLTVAARTSVFLSGLTIRGGQLTPTGTDTAEGAGIDNHGHLTLSGCVVTGNTIAGSSNSTADGAGIFNDSALTVVGGSIAANSANGDVSFGGGVYNGSGLVTLVDCTVSGNAAGGIGGGQGGGVYSRGSSSVLTRCTLSGNSTSRPSGGGGGFYIDSGTAALADCTVTNNGGAAGAGVYNGGGTLTLSDCTLAGNSGDFPGGAGGGVYNAGTTELIACTIAGNVLTGAGVQGGGLFHAGGNLTLTACIVTGNAAPGSGSDGGGGLFIVPNQGYVHLVNTIVAGNSTGTEGPDVFGTVVSVGHNLVGVTDGSSGWVDSDLTGSADAPLDPLLGSLGNYGGPTQTIPLLPGSPALNAGDSSLLGIPDQRGVVRGGGVNIGAFQATASMLALAAPATVTAGTPFNVTVTALDPYRQVAVGYTGTVDLQSTDPMAPDLGSHAFTLDDGGVYTFAGVTLYTVGSQSLLASDGSISGQFDLTVGPGPRRWAWIYVG
jgi:hypothetical protein